MRILKLYQFLYSGIVMVAYFSAVPDIKCLKIKKKNTFSKKIWKLLNDFEQFLHIIIQYK